MSTADSTVYESDATGFKIVGKTESPPGDGLIAAKLAKADNAKRVLIYQDLALDVEISPQIPAKFYFVRTPSGDEARIVGVALGNEYGFGRMIRFSESWLRSHRAK